MFSFYGNGPQGKNFKIAKVFNTYTALLEDCQASEVRDGDLVVISYGEVGTEAYTGNLNEDSSYGNKNSTFWEKHYYPNETEDNNIVFSSNIHKGSGWGYRFIAQMTGNTPDISISVLQDIIPGSELSVEKAGNSDTPQFTFHLERGIEVWVKEIHTFNSKPVLNLDTQIGISDLIISSNNFKLYKVKGILKDNPFYLELIDLNVKLSPTFNEPITETLSPNESASVKLTGNESNGYTFTFKIPKGDTGVQGPQGERGLQGDSLVFIGVENVISFDLVSDSTFASYNPTTTNEVVVVTAGEESRWYFKLNGHWTYTVSSGSSLVWQEL